MLKIPLTLNPWGYPVPEQAKVAPSPAEGAEEGEEGASATCQDV